MTVSCSRCGETWARDPALVVPCPQCLAPAGVGCIRPSGHRAAELHRARDQAALDAGLIAPCSALTWDKLHQGRQLVADAPAQALLL